MHLKSVKLGTILAMAAALAALAAVVFHTTSLRAPMAERRAALTEHAEALNTAPVTMFQTVALMNAEAVDSFRQRLSTGPTDAASARYDALFPRFGDGTRRSTDALFDGVEMEDGQQVLGVGAFIGDADAMSADQEFWFTSGFEAVRRIGPQYVTPGSSLYYFTPDRRMVMYAPFREDKLSFYRHTAPADFNLRADEDPILFGAGTNPQRELQCTRLSFFISSEGGERSAMACRTPVWQGDVLVGAFGSSFEVGDILAAATSDVPLGGAVWVLMPRDMSSHATAILAPARGSSTRRHSGQNTPWPGNSIWRACKTRCSPFFPFPMRIGPWSFERRSPTSSTRPACVPSRSSWFCSGF